MSVGGFKFKVLFLVEWFGNSTQWVKIIQKVSFFNIYWVSKQVLVKISNLREIRILKFLSKKFVKLKGDLHCLARM